MRNLFTIFCKDLRGFFLSPFGWVVLTLVTIMQGWSMSGAMKALQDAPIPESLVYIVFHMPQFWFYFLGIFPLITMRLFSEVADRSMRARAAQNIYKKNELLAWLWFCFVWCSRPPVVF